MGDKLGGALFALLFAVCFGAVGVFACGAMATALWEGVTARDWIRVRADIVKYDGDGIQYRYRLGDKDYSGNRMGVGWLQSSEVDAEVDARISAAVNEKKPITVFVDPAEPSKSLVDPQIPWMMMAFMTPFAFGFGGVGLGAAYALFRIMMGDAKKKSAAPLGIKSAAGGEALGLWIFAFFWNVISFPIALIAVPDMLRSGEWLGLLVLIVPLVGVLMLWAAVRSTWRLVRRGKATLALSNTEPRMGLPLSGHVAFPRGVKRGDAFRARLLAYRTPDEGSPVQLWFKDATIQAIEASDGPRVNFRFDVPRKIATVEPGEYEDLSWKLELFHGQQARAAAYSFGLELEPAPDLAADETSADPEEAPVPAGMAPMMAGIAAIVGQAKVDRMTPAQRAQMAARMSELTPDQRDQVAKLVKAGPFIKKLVIAVIVLFVAVQVISVVISIVVAS